MSFALQPQLCVICQAKVKTHRMNVIPKFLMLIFRVKWNEVEASSTGKTYNAQAKYKYLIIIHKHGAQVLHLMRNLQLKTHRLKYAACLHR